jgi:hypothetical protein
MECIEFLLKNPLFSGKIHYQPRKDFDATGNRIYSEWITSDGAWDLQVRIFPLPLHLLLLTKRFRAASPLMQPSLASHFRPTKPGSV